MARVLSKTLISRSHPRPPLLSVTHLRSRHTVAKGGTLIEIDLETSSAETRDSSAVRIINLGDVMHTIIAQKSAPSWLPFIPGSSYWVPPKSSPKNVANLLKKCAFGGRPTPTLSREEALSLTTVRGWPSSHHLLKADSESEIQVNVLDIKSEKPDSEKE